MIRFKSPRDIEKMRKAGGALAEVFLDMAALMVPDAVTIDIDKAFENAIRNRKARPAFKGYRGGAKNVFPASTCISIDSEIVHGIPSKRKLANGQLVGIDCGLELDGWYSDMAASFLIGEVSELKRKLWRVTLEALYLGIAQAKSGNRVNDIGGAVQDHVEKQGFSVIRGLVGHGIGIALHEDPAVPNFRNQDGNVAIRPGMTIAIEPMIAAGDYKMKTLSDGWTAATKDSSPSCHFEHTIAVTENGPEILTLLPDGRDPWEVITGVTKDSRA